MSFEYNDMDDEHRCCICCCITPAWSWVCLNWECHKDPDPQRAANLRMEFNARETLFTNRRALASDWIASCAFLEYTHVPNCLDRAWEQQVSDIRKQLSTFPDQLTLKTMKVDTELLLTCYKGVHHRISDRTDAAIRTVEELSSDLTTKVFKNAEQAAVQLLVELGAVRCRLWNLECLTNEIASKLIWV